MIGKNKTPTRQEGIARRGRRERRTGRFGGLVDELASVLWNKKSL